MPAEKLLRKYSENIKTIWHPIISIIRSSIYIEEKLKIQFLTIIKIKNIIENTITTKNKQGRKRF